jgi:hypothetical protein
LLKSGLEDRAATTVKIGSRQRKMAANKSIWVENGQSDKLLPTQTIRAFASLRSMGSSA